MKIALFIRKKIQSNMRFSIWKLKVVVNKYLWRFNPFHPNDLLLVLDLSLIPSTRFIMPTSMIRIER